MKKTMTNFTSTTTPTGRDGSIGPTTPHEQMKQTFFSLKSEQTEEPHSPEMQKKKRAGKLAAIKHVYMDP